LARSFSLRLAALYAGAFALAVIVLGVVTLLATRAALRRQFDARIGAETAGLAQEFRTEGLSSVVQAVGERDRSPGALDYGLQGAQGQPLAGKLANARTPLGWSSLPKPQASGEVESIRVLTTVLPDGHRLVVGNVDEQSEELQHTVLASFAWAFAGVVALGIIGGYGLGRDVHRRLATMTAAAEAIIDGDLARRIPEQGSNDDLDRVAAAFNRMLDRIASLMNSLRQVSDDIAHDLRTPLTRLRQKLEASLALESAAARAEAVSSALSDMDAILETFAGLLRIAQIEGGARRAGFQSVDMAALARTVVEAFAPSAEDAGQSLSLADDGPLLVVGDPELLTQMLVNLVDNALRHTGASARIMVSIHPNGGDVELTVTDDGPGVPETERERIFDRLYRLERNRSTPGSGLGLALVAAIARLHGARITLADTRPGLQVRVALPAARSQSLGNPNVSDRMGSVSTL
jgi:signal transduction histidine kinase